MRLAAAALGILMVFSVLAVAEGPQVFKASVSKPVFKLKNAEGSVEEVPAVTRTIGGQAMRQQLPGISSVASAYLVPAEELATPMTYVCTDYSGNEWTDLPDLAHLATHYGSCLGRQLASSYDYQADYDQDGCVDKVDYEIIKFYWNTQDEANYYCSHETGTRRCPDINQDNEFDTRDLVMLAGSYRKCLGDEGFNEAADFDDDKCVSDVDKEILAKHIFQPLWRQVSPYCSQPT